MKNFATILAAGLVGLTFSARATTVVVDGRGANGAYANLSAALTALQRNDGEADIIQVTAANLVEPGSVAVVFSDDKTDPLSIVGSAPNGPSVLVFGAKTGEYAVDITGNAAAQFTLKNITLIPEHVAGGQSKLARDFAHGGIRLRLKDQSAKAARTNGKVAAQIIFEDVVVTASLENNVAANPTNRMGNYDPHTRWNGAAGNTPSAAFVVEGRIADPQGCNVTFTRCRAAHTGTTGFLLHQGSGIKVALNGSSAKFGAQDGFQAQQSNGALALRDCDGSWNQGLGFMYASGTGRLDLEQCRFDCNTGRGVQIGGDSGANIPSQINIRGGSFSENGWTDYNLSSYRKFEYGILVWGGSATTLSIQGTPENPVLFLENFRRGLRIDNSKARLERIEHAIFAGRHFESGVELVNLDLSVSPTLSHCAFIANSYKSTYHSQLTISDDNTDPATFNINDCTFYNASGKGAHHIAIEDFSDKPTQNLTLNINRTIFAGGPAGQGTDEKALYLDGINCTARFTDCALVTEGPYALNAKYIDLNLSGRGNQVFETKSIHADPNFFPSRCTLRNASDYAASGQFLQPQSAAYQTARISGYNQKPGAAAAAIKPIRVAIYVDQGPDLVDIFQTQRILQGCTDITVEEIKARDIWDGCLERFDVIMFPGGSSAAEARSLKEKGRGQVQDFLKQGGGYIGTCAGAYLLMPGQNYTGLNILDAKAADYQHWARGHGIVQMELTPIGKEILGDHYTDNSIEYWQGPLMVPSGKTENSGFLSLAKFKTEIHDKGAPAGVMAGTTAIAAGQHGSGRYVAISCHPEGVITPTFRGDYVYNAILWAASRKSPAP